MIWQFSYSTPYKPDTPISARGPNNLYISAYKSTNSFRNRTISSLLQNDLIIVTLLQCKLYQSYYMECAMRKRVFGHIRAAKTLIRLRIRAVWSGPSLSASRLIAYYRMYEWRAKRPGWYFVRAQDDQNLRSLRMFEGTFSLDEAHMFFQTSTLHYENTPI